jgi:hypothetical protein
VVTGCLFNLHRIELSDLKVSDSQIEKVAKQQYGDNNEYSKEIEDIMSDKFTQEEKAIRKNKLAK